MTASSLPGYLAPFADIIQQAAVGTLSPTETTRAAQILKSAGLNVTCSGNTTLSGIYAADDAALTKLMAVQNFIDRNARFPGNVGSYTVADITGGAHIFPIPIATGGASAPSFTKLVYALMDFAAACDAVAISSAGVLPNVSVIIP
jgi:hypothetical protein